MSISASWIDKKWIPVAERLPAIGERVVVEFAQGTVWAGRYQGRKQSFARWMPLP